MLRLWCVAVLAFSSAVVALPLVFQRATPASEWKDQSRPTVQFVAVDKDVKLEVLDWGGSGRPLVFLAGLGNTAYVFDNFAPKFTAAYHVYGITRRGFGGSSVPASGYSADRLGEDVIAALDALKLSRPVLVGHSIAGEELSSIGSRHPKRVAGLIYLDAGYAYAYYDRSRGDFNLDLIELRKKLEQLAYAPVDTHLIQQLLETSLPGFERDMRRKQADLQAVPAALLAAQVPSVVDRLIIAGEQKYTKIPVPILAIYAVPHDFGRALGNDPDARAAYEARDEITTGAQADAFAKGVRSAKVVRLPHADHYVFQSNEADVLREMNAFLGKLQ